MVDDIRRVDQEGALMATKSDFTEQEWDQLRKGATGAGLLVSASDRSFFDSFKEAGSLAKHLAGGRSGSSELVRELAGERGMGFGVSSSTAEIESGTLEAKAPDEVEAYRTYVLEVAEAVGKSAGGGEVAEAEAVEKIRSALA